MSRFKIKICGMKHPDNLKEIAALSPDYFGFIFYPKSKRFVGNAMSEELKSSIPQTIRKVGVFVNETVESMLNAQKENGLDLLQLHGNESPKTCKLLNNKGIDIIKAFSVDEQFDFDFTTAYKESCKFFLFDTKCKGYGGSGKKFDWEILRKYDNEKSIFLSGGIGPEDAKEILNLDFLNIHALDINSKFEIEPGLKEISLLKTFFRTINIR